MTNTESKTEYKIDATNQRLGQVATQAANYLIGKNLTTFVKNVAPDVTVTIENVAKLDIPEKKKIEIYQSFSGYPGGRKEETLKHLGERLGYSEVLKRTIKGMLPKNKLQSIRMKNLKVTE